MKPSRATILYSAALSTLLSVSTSVQAAGKTNYQDDVLPIFRNTCLNCHNPDKKKAGLDLSTYSASVAGSSNGPVLNAGDPDGSLLFKVLNHTEEPSMPPKSDKLPAKDLNVIRDWIAGGVLETANGKPIVSNRPKVNLAVAATGMKRPDGPAPMPKDLLPEPVVRSARPWAAGCIAASPWAPIVAIGAQHQVLIYNTDTLSLLGVVPFPEGTPRAVQFSKNGKILLIGGGIAAKSGKVSLWDVTTGQKLTDVGEEFDEVLAADISADQTMVALGGPAKVFKIFSIRDGSLMHVIKKHTDWVTACAYSPDGNMVASADRAGGMWVWEAKSANELYNLAGHKAAVSSVAFRDDSGFLASGSEDGAVKLWEMNEGKEVKTLQAHSGGVLSVAFAHDGKLVTCGRDRQVKIWSPDGNLLKTLDTFGDIAIHAAFDHTGARVVAGDWSGELHVLDAADPKVIGSLSTNPLPLAERLAAAEKSLPEVQAAAEKAKADAAQAQKNADAAAENAKAAAKAVDEAKAGIAKAQDDYKTSNDLVQSLKPKIAEAQATSQRKATAVGAAKDASASATTAKTSAEKKLAAAKDKLADRQKAADGAAPDSEAVAKLEKAKSEVAEAQAKLDSAAEAAKAADEALTKAKNAADDAKKQLADLTAQADKARADRSAADAAQPKLKASIPKLQKQIPVAAAAATDAQAAADKAKANAELAAKKIDYARQDIARLKLGQFYMSVYEARQDQAAREADLEKANADLKAAEQEIVDDTAAIEVARQLRENGAAKLQAAKKTSVDARAAVAPLTTVADAAKTELEQRRALLAAAEDLSSKLTIQSKKIPDNKAIADAAAKSQATTDALKADVAVVQKDADAKAEALKKATANADEIEASRQKLKADVANAPQKAEQMRVAIAAAKASLPKLKAKIETAAKSVDQAKTKTAALTAEYNKKSLESGLDGPQANAK